MIEGSKTRPLSLPPVADCVALALRPSASLQCSQHKRVNNLPPGGRLFPAMPTATPIEVTRGDTDTTIVNDRPWIVLVWNDPINLMSYVTFVIQKVFGYPKEKAEKLMWDVHTVGRAVVSNGNREKAEMDVFRLHEHGLWATMQQDD